MKNLPITHILPKVKALLATHTRLVLQAPPGAGKTTALPLALLDEPWLEGKQIMMLEPRRLAVRSSASRMAELLGERVGERIGYQIKMESVQSDATKILIVTEGILTRKLQADPSLEGVGLIIFDEFHERSLHADLALALALESQEILREDLRLLVMSATLNTTAISQLLEEAPIVQSEGRSFPVERIYLDPTTPQPTVRELPFYLHKRLLRLLEEEEGNILVFLAGVGEIKKVEQLLRASKLRNLYISPLYGNLSKEAQDRAIQAPPEGERKIVLSTNIAQTSLTIEGITVVVDSGVHNVSVFSPLSGMNRLERQFISQDAATQRAGRAGRLSAGKAYHLWHASKILPKHDQPEILSADLSQLLLELALWGDEDITSYRWMEMPPPSAVAHAKSLLVQLGALDAKGGITEHGRAMSQLPLHPRLSHMMIQAKALDMGYEASLLAVILTEKDIYTQRNNSSDLKERLMVLHEVAQGRGIKGVGVNLAHCRTLLAQARQMSPIRKASLNHELLGVLVAFAYPDRVAQLRHHNRGIYLLSNGKGASLHPEETLFNARFLVVADLDAKQTNATIYKAIEITQDQIESHLSERIQEENSITWSEELERVEVRCISRLGAIHLREQPTHDASEEEILEVLLEELEEQGIKALSWSKEAISLKDRINFLNYHGMALPCSEDAYLEANMQEWLAPYLLGMRRLQEVKALDLYSILLGRLSYEEQRQLHRLAPSRLQVASGSMIPIDYENPAQPILAVRLQELFGTPHTPTLLNGKVTLMIHLLSPAHRPMQMTTDLMSFWLNTYDEVKKELRGRYKKHYWPDNPLEAQATSRTKKFM